MIRYWFYLFWSSLLISIFGFLSGDPYMKVNTKMPEKPGVRILMTKIPHGGTHFPLDFEVFGRGGGIML